MGSFVRSLAITAIAGTAATLTPARAAAQLVVDAELREACEVIRLGDAIDVPEWLAFSRTPSIRLDAFGGLYLRGEDSQVAVLEPDGSLVRYVGGEGEGPGEFTDVGRFGFVGDTLWLQDLWELDISYFDSTGAHIRTETDHGLPSTMPILWRTSAPLADGHGFYIPPTGQVDLESRTAPDFERVKLPMMVGVRSEESRDTLAFSYNHTGMLLGDGVFAHRPFVTPPLYRIHPRGEGVVTVDWEPNQPGEVLLRHYGLDGRIERETAIEARLRSVSREARNAIIEEGMEAAERGVAMARQLGGDAPTSLRTAVTEGLLLYDYFEPVSSFFLTHDERVWLSDAAVPEDDEALWIVLGPEGEPEFRVQAPTGIAFRTALGDRVWATGRTELDVPFIVQYELVAPGECG
ncbi:MAG: hypothetical protein F4187_04965 [Gemmatimonadetes bacterium]|nr:hypothetical protein [Gemmatimonadota bacterium]